MTAIAAKMQHIAKMKITSVLMFSPLYEIEVNHAVFLRHFPGSGKSLEAASSMIALDLTCHHAGQLTSLRCKRETYQ